MSTERRSALIGAAVGVAEAAQSGEEALDILAGALLVIAGKGAYPEDVAAVYSIWYGDLRVTIHPKEGAVSDFIDAEQKKKLS